MKPLTAYLLGVATPHIIYASWILVEWWTIALVLIAALIMTVLILIHTLGEAFTR